MGFETITVLGGDRTGGPARCVPHAAELRRQLARDLPGLGLGGWINPHADTAMQVDLLESPDFAADFFLTQIVSHHDLAGVETLVREMRRRGIQMPGAFGVFLYRSARPGTLSHLARFFPVPAEKLTREFEQGLSSVEICARTIRALRAIGIDKVYVSNFRLERVDRLYVELVEAVNSGSG
jgi:hypothetical protein